MTLPDRIPALMRRGWPALAALAMFALAPFAAAKVPVKVSGLGWLHDRDMRIALERLTGALTADSLDANGIEDAAVILNSSLNDEGFQEPEITVAATLADGAVKRFRFDPTFMTPVPRPLAAKAVTFAVQPGVRWRVAKVAIEGLTVMKAKVAEGYFRSNASLLTVATTNAYSKSQLSRSETALLDELKRRGYAEATVRADVDLPQNPQVRDGEHRDLGVHDGGRDVPGELVRRLCCRGRTLCLKVADVDVHDGHQLAPGCSRASTCISARI